MSGQDITPVFLWLAVLLGAAHVASMLCAWGRQPRFIGELIVGVVIGPSGLDVLPKIGSPHLPSALGFLHWLGLLLLMFVSGTEARGVLSRENRRPTTLLLAIGTALPFAIIIIVGSTLSLERLAGPRGSETAVLVVLATATAVTSIPVITRIFADLGIVRTRFASLILGVAVLDDIVLWIVIAILTTVARQLPESLAASAIASHALFTVSFLAAGLLWLPRVLARLHRARWNLLEQSAPTSYAIMMLMTYTALAAHLGVTLALAGFLAGFGLVGGAAGDSWERFAPSLAGIQRVAFALPIPMYFVVVGSQIDFGSVIDGGLVLAFFIGSSVVRGTAVMTASRVAGFDWLSSINLAVTANARGGPGIVLATIVYDAGVISSELFTALIVTAIVTSQLAGAWLGYVQRRGWELLRDGGHGSTIS